MSLVPKQSVRFTVSVNFDKYFTICSKSTVLVFFEMVCSHTWKHEVGSGLAIPDSSFIID